MSIKCDVLVVGGGPAGLSAALFLSNKSFSTIVLEKSKTCGPKHTKYDITEGNRIREIIDEIGINTNKTSSRSEWISPNYSHIIESEIEDFYFKRGPGENSLENVLLKKLNNKVDVFFKSKVNFIELKKKEIATVKINKDRKKIEIKPRYVIVADGPESEFRKRLNIDTEYFAKFNGFGVLIGSCQSDLIPHAKIYLDEKIAPGGYIYSGSVGKEIFFCLMTDDKFTKKESLKHRLNFFLERNMKEKFTVKNYFGGIGISGIQEVLLGNTLFIGGAALFYDPFLGYGLNYAIESAYFAANAIKKNDLSIYTEYANRIQKEFKDIFFAREIWRKADNNFFDKLIRAFNGEYDNSDEKINKILDLFNED